MGQFPVGAQEEQAFGVVVESTNGHEAERLLGNQIGDGFPTLRIFHRRHDAIRLEEHDGRRVLRASDHLAIERYLVVVGFDGGPQSGHDLPVYRDSAIEDGFLGSATRHGSRSCEVYVKTDLPHRSSQEGSVGGSFGVSEVSAAGGASTSSTV